MDYSIYRLNDWSWLNQYKERYGEEYYRNYSEKIYGMLDQLKKGRCYDLSTIESSGSTVFQINYVDKNGKPCCETNPDLFIKLCCSYILECDDYIISDDYQKIRRL